MGSEMCIRDRSEWDWYMPAGEGRFSECTPGDLSFAIVLPDEGFQSRRRHTIGYEEMPTEKWRPMFEACYRTYTNLGFIPVLVDYHI